MNIIPPPFIKGHINGKAFNNKEVPWIFAFLKQTNWLWFCDEGRKPLAIYYLSGAFVVWSNYFEWSLIKVMSYASYSTVVHSHFLNNIFPELNMGLQFCDLIAKDVKICSFPEKINTFMELAAEPMGPKFIVALKVFTKTQQNIFRQQCNHLFFIFLLKNPRTPEVS